MKKLKEIFKNLGYFIYSVIAIEVLITGLMLFLFYQDIATSNTYVSAEKYFDIWLKLIIIAPCGLIIWIIIQYIKGE